LIGVYRSRAEMDLTFAERKKKKVKRTVKAKRKGCRKLLRTGVHLEIKKEVVRKKKETKKKRRWNKKA